MPKLAQFIPGIYNNFYYKNSRVFFWCYIFTYLMFTLCFKRKSILFFDLLHEFVVRGQIDIELIDHTLNLNYLSMQ